MAHAPPRHRRSPATNALGRALLILGDHRNLSIIREAFRSCRRFGDWQSVLDISPPVLAGRLRSLVDDGIFELAPYSSAPPRYEYRLTDAGKDLWPVFVALWTWEQRWGDGSSPPATLIHHRCSQPTRPLLACSACGVLAVGAHDTSADYSDPFSAANPPRRYRRATRSDDVDANESVMSAIDLLGDRWSTSLLSAAFLGASRFKDFQGQLGTIPPLILADRLDIFVKQQVLRRTPIAPGAKRMEYKLAPKGLDFFAVLTSLVAWTNEWLAPADAPPIVIRHRHCGRVFVPAWVCNVCNVPLERREIHFEVTEASAATG
jgi:DNA-binding HxlR family transcriptional regulator